MSRIWVKETIQNQGSLSRICKTLDAGAYIPMICEVI